MAESRDFFNALVAFDILKGREKDKEQEKKNQDDLNQLRAEARELRGPTPQYTHEQAWQLYDEVCRTDPEQAKILQKYMVNIPRPQPASVVPVRQIGPPPPGPVCFCIYCGNRHARTDNFCGACGQRINK